MQQVRGLATQERRSPKLNDVPTLQVVASPLPASPVGLSPEEWEIVHHLRFLASQLPTGWGRIVAEIEVRDRQFTHFDCELKVKVALGKERRQAADAAYRGARR